VLRFSPWRGAVIRKNSSQRQNIVTAALAANEQLAVPPVDVIEAQPGDLPRPQPKPRQQQQQDREITPADQSAPITASQQLLHRRWLQAARQRAIPQIGDRRDRPHQRHLDQPRQM
jgi:hypothetical protein